MGWDLQTQVWAVLGLRAGGRNRGRKMTPRWGRWRMEGRDGEKTESGQREHKDAGNCAL